MGGWVSVVAIRGASTAFAWTRRPVRGRYGRPPGVASGDPPGIAPSAPLPRSVIEMASRIPRGQDAGSPDIWSSGRPRTPHRDDLQAPDRNGNSGVVH